MRLFIAINFPEKIKIKLYNTISELRNNSRKGNFTKIENLHLILIFLGEVPISKISNIKQIINKHFNAPIKLEFDKIGTFKRNNGDIYWIGIKENKSLSELYSLLFNDLTKSGFNIEKRKFVPHITIGREIITNKNIDLKISSSPSNVNAISLMSSERINGRLIYKPEYEKTID